MFGWIARFSLVMLFVLSAGSNVFAAEVVDFLGIEGAPASVIKILTPKLRRAISQQKAYKLLPPNSMNLTMARLTLGCVGDSPNCMKQFGAMRKAKWLFHVRLLPLGSRVKALFRKIDAQTGQSIKTATLIFKKKKASQAAQQLITKMFGPPPNTKIVAAKKKTQNTPNKKTPKAIPAKKKTLSTLHHAAKKSIPAKKKTLSKKVVPVKKRIDSRKAKASLKIISTKKKETQATKKKETQSSSLTSRPNFWGWVLLGVAVVSAAGVVTFGLDAQSKQDEVKARIAKSKKGAPLSYKKEILPLEEDGRTSATVANVFLGVSLASAASAIVLFSLTPEKNSSQEKTALRSMPERSSKRFSAILPTVGKKMKFGMR